MVHPALVCSVLWFGSTSFTPSMMSTSPELGQSASSVSQAAGQVAQPWGMWRISILQNCGEYGRWDRCDRTYTTTCVVYAALLFIRTLFRPGSEAARVVVKSVRMMKVSPEA